MFIGCSLLSVGCGVHANLGGAEAQELAGECRQNPERRAYLVNQDPLQLVSTSSSAFRYLSCFYHIFSDLHNPRL